MGKSKFTFGKLLSMLCCHDETREFLRKNLGRKIFALKKGLLISLDLMPALEAFIDEYFDYPNSAGKLAKLFFKKKMFFLAVENRPIYCRMIKAEDSSTKMLEVINYKGPPMCNFRYYPCKEKLPDEESVETILGVKDMFVDGYFATIERGGKMYKITYHAFDEFWNDFKRKEKTLQSCILEFVGIFKYAQRARRLNIVKALLRNQFQRADYLLYSFGGSGWIFVIIIAGAHFSIKTCYYKTNWKRVFKKI